MKRMIIQFTLFVVFVMVSLFAHAQTETADSVFYYNTRPVIFDINKSTVNKADLQWLKDTLKVQLDSAVPGTRVLARTAASPEGPIAWNKYLARARRSAVETVLGKLGVETSDIKFDVIDEDYELLRTIMHLRKDADSHIVDSLMDKYHDQPTVLKTKMRQVRGGKMWNRLFRTYFFELRAVRMMLIPPAEEAKPDTVVAELPPEPAPVVEKPDTVVIEPAPEPAPVVEEPAPVVKVKEPRQPMLAVKTNLLLYGLYVPQYGYAPAPNLGVEFLPRHGKLTIGASLDMPWYQYRSNHRFFQIRNWQLEGRRYFIFQGDAQYWGLYAQAYIHTAVWGVGFSKEKGWEGESVGGACQNKGGNANIYMTGGIVEGGIYGGSNSSGTLSGFTNIHIDGGQVGTTTTSANVHGGGYGSSTIVSKNVDVMLGTKTSGDCGYETTGTAVVYGDVYGGSALGKTNGTSATTTYKTNVTLNKGTIHGSLYGGALGDASTEAIVYGPVAVKVYGGSIYRTKVTGVGRTVGSDNYIWGSGGVYGCNNVNGAPQSTVTVDIYGTDAAPTDNTYALYSVYGGGNLSAYTKTPTVAVHNCDNSIEYVYGGGNAADVSGTDVTIWGGNVIGNVFGGGNGSADGWPTSIAAENPGADVNGTAAVKINGGTIEYVFGGSNTKGLISGGTSVTVNQQKESTSCDECPMNISNIFGAGNNAPYTGNTSIKILNTLCADGTTTGIVGNVFGGGKGETATVTGDSYVEIGQKGSGKVTINGNIYGGGDYGTLSGTTNISVHNPDTKITGDIYGGGCRSMVGNTNTLIYGVDLDGNIYGGGFGTETIDAQVGTNAGVNGDAVTKIYGGSFQGIFGAGNVQSTILNKVDITLDEVDGLSECSISSDEIYGAGNEAAVDCQIYFTLGCLSGKIEEMYGGAKNADYGTAAKPANITLNIKGGSYGKIFGGNNLGGTVYGKIQINIQHTGCKPIQIGELYGGGNLADYRTDLIPDAALSTGEEKSNYPEINLLSCGQSTIDWVNDDDDKHCLKIGTIYGAGKGENGTDKGKVTGNPQINVYAGEIGTIYGGGNLADVKGNPVITIQDKATGDNQDIYITNNVYGGGNNAKVEGKTTVNIK